MWRRNTILAWLIAAAAAGVTAGAANPGQPSPNAMGDAPQADAVAMTWQHREGDFEYFGTLSRYTCFALEEQVRRIFAYLGARDDMKVVARGCSRGPDIVSHTASVHVDFYVPEPAAGAAAANAPLARWTPVELTPRRPGFVEIGDCELVEAMKNLVLKSFSLRGVTYTTSCYPNEINIWAFSVKGEALKLPAHKP